MHVLEHDFSIRAACVQHDCATCASMQRDAVTAAQSRFLATRERADLDVNVGVAGLVCCGTLLTYSVDP